MSNFTLSPFKVTSLAGLLLLAASRPAAAQVGVGTTSPHAKAAVEIAATDKGLLIPRMLQSQRQAMMSVPDGLMVFQTDGTTGFWYYFGGQWNNIPNASTAGDNLGNHTATQNVALNSTHDLLLRGGSDPNHGLGWYGTGKLWNGIGIDGPVLYGFAGGALGINLGGTKSSVLSWTSGGRVGIGTSTPAARLDLQAGADNNGSNDQQALAFSYRTGGYRHWVRSRHNSGLGAGGNALDFYVNNSTGAAGSSAPTTGTRHVLTLDNNSGARVGIGTTSPAATLHVSGTTSTVKLDGLTGTGTRVVTTDASGNLGSVTTASLADNLGNHTATQALGLNGNWLSNDGGSEGLRVANDGKVGIGTGSPQEELHVVGDARVSGLGDGSSTRMVVAGTDGTLAAQALPVSPQSVAWSLTGNAGTASATNFLGTTDNQSLAIRTNNTERMRVLNSGQVVVGSTTTSTSDALAAYGIYAVNGYSTVAGGAGLYGTNNTASGVGVWGLGLQASGSGIWGVGNNLGTAHFLTGGQGGALSGTVTGVYGRSTTSGAGQAAYFDQFGVIGRVNYWNGTTQFKIQGTGTVSTIVEDQAGQWRTMFCAESPEYYFTDYGQGKLVNGRAHIELDPILGRNIIISEEHPLRVFVQLEGECKGVFVTNKTATGFDVVELNEGSSNTPFQWNIVCNVADQKLPNGRVSKFSDIRFQKVAPNLETREIKVEKEAAGK